MLKSIIRGAFSVIVMLAAPFALAEDLAPDLQMKKLSEELIALIKQDREIRAGNPKRIAEVVETRILPLFNFVRMTQSAMGANWRRATPEQQEKLAREFQNLLVRTYSGAMTSYRDQVIEFKPARAQVGETDVLVRSEVRSPGTQAIPIDYQMEKTGSGWKVYDVKVGGVSLVTTYRETFAEVVRSGGVDGLIDTLASKNRSNNAKSRPAQS